MSSLATTLVVWDRAAFHAINGGLATPLLDNVMPHVSDLGLGHVQAAFVLALPLWFAAVRGEFRPSVNWTAVRLAVWRRRSWVGPMLVAIVIAGFAANVGKGLVPRMRPSWFYVNEHKQGRHLDVSVHTIAGIRPLRVNGFPSGHTCTSFAIAGVVALSAARRKGRSARIALAYGCACAIALSRIYLADHWPLDVAGGVVLGSLASLAALAVCRKWAGAAQGGRT